MAAAVTKAPASPFAGAEVVDLFEFYLHDRDNHQLGNALAGFDGEVDIVEQGLLAEVQLNLSQRDQGHESASC